MNKYYKKGDKVLTCFFSKEGEVMETTESMVKVKYKTFFGHKEKWEYNNMVELINNKWKTYIATNAGTTKKTLAAEVLWKVVNCNGTERLLLIIYGIGADILIKNRDQFLFFHSFIMEYAITFDDKHLMKMLFQNNKDKYFQQCNISEITGHDRRMVTYIIRKLREDGLPIISNEKGYCYTTNEIKLRDFIGEFESTAKRKFMIAKKMRDRIERKGFFARLFK